MIKLFFILATAGLFSACTSNQAWNTAQVIKDLDCNDNSRVSYKHCDTRLEDEYQQAQELKREMEEKAKKEEEIQAALSRSATSKETKKSERDKP